jgi:hypothetical protein
MANRNFAHRRKDRGIWLCVAAEEQSRRHEILLIFSSLFGSPISAAKNNYINLILINENTILALIDSKNSVNLCKKKP